MRRKLNSKAILATLLILAVSVGAIVSSHRTPPSSQELRNSPPVTQAARKSAMPRSSVDISAIRKYLPESLDKKPVSTRLKPRATVYSPGDLVAEVRSDAEAGSPSAMYWMGIGLRKCSTADMGSDEEIEATEARRSIGLDAMKVDRGETVDPSTSTRDAENRVRAAEKIRDQCKGFSAEQIASWRDWFQRSAAAGDGEARGTFAHEVMTEFKDPQYRLENYERFKSQNEIATEYLKDSVANGDCGFMILNGFDWVEADPTSAYVYRSLLLKNAANYYVNQPNLDQRTWDAEMTSISSSLKNLALKVPADQIAEADAAANYILQNVCRSF